MQPVYKDNAFVPRMLLPLASPMITASLTCRWRALRDRAHQGAAELEDCWRQSSEFSPDPLSDIGNFKDVEVIEYWSSRRSIELETPLVTLETEKATMDCPRPRRA